MNIGFVNNNYQLGGAETVVQQLFAGCTKAGHRAKFYVSDGKSYPWRRGVRPLYPRILSWLDHSRFRSTIDQLAPRAIWTDRAFQKLSNGRSDILHIHAFHGTYATIESLAQLAKKKPVVWTFHRFWGITGGCDHPGECRRYLESCGNCPRVNEWPICGADNTETQLRKKVNYLAGQPLNIVSPSRHLATSIKQSRVGRSWRVSHIPNGVDPDCFRFSRKQDPEFRRSLGLSASGTVVLIVNRNFRDPVKGFAVIERALHELPRVAGVQFAFAGEHSDWAIGLLPKTLDAIDLGYVSSRDQMGNLFEAADIFLYSSPGENFPCVILEAMSSKCCVVSTPTDGVLEQIEDGVSGVIASSFDPTCLVEALRRAIEDIDLRRTCGEAARERVRNRFSESKMIEDYLALYKEVLEQGTAS
jgi:glycosyltransferase involved in cell wall biosynthesis